MQSVTTLLSPGRFGTAPVALIALLALGTGAQAQTLPNGGSVAGSVSPVGDVDSFNFFATAGEGLQIQVADTSGGSLWPAMRVYAPGGALIQTVNSSSATGVVLTAGSTGNYTVEISDWYAASTGGYEVHFARMPGADEGGALSNDGLVSSSIVLGDLDSYTFTATAGEFFQLQIADSGGTSFWPAMRLYGPDGALIQTVNGSSATGYARVAGLTGTYTVVVSDWYVTGAGEYDLYFSRQPGANEGGEIPNGGVASGTVDLGDLDSYSFDAVAGEGYQLQVADASGTSFWPVMRVFDPSGSLLVTSNGSSVAATVLTAGTTGTYTVVVSDWYLTGFGDYDLYFSLRPGSNEGGALVNGSSVSETIDLGDLDSYTFGAVAGEGLQLQVADTSGTSFWPAMRLYGPSGSLLQTVNGSSVAGLVRTAGTTGVYTVVISDWYTTGAGDYELFFTRVPGADEGGSLPNGGAVEGVVDLGDLDSYTLPLVAGESFHLQIADTTGGSFWPVMRLYDPTGALLQTANGSSVAAILRTAGMTGTHTLVVSDWYQTGAGSYEVHYARMPGANEGGGLVNGGGVSASLDLGDLDSYTFAATAGDSYELVVTDLGGLWPAVRVFDPAGGLLQTANGSSGATISRLAGSTGTYTVVVSDWYLTGVGGYQLTLNRNLETYCTPGTSANGCAAVISATGNASANEASGFVVSVAGAEGDKDGLFFFGTSGRQASSWGNGTSLQCVVPPVKRGGLLNGSGASGQCDGAFSQDFNALWQASPSKNPGAGAVVQAQLWYRDPQNTSNQTTSLSDAVEFTVAP